MYSSGMQIPTFDITEKRKCDVNFFASLTDRVTHNNLRLLSRSSSPQSFKRSNQHVTSVRHPPPPPRSAKNDDKFSYTQAEKVIFVRYKLSQLGVRSPNITFKASHPLKGYFWTMRNLTTCALWSVRSEVTFCFVLFQNFWLPMKLQYQPNGRWYMSKLFNQTSRLSMPQNVYRTTKLRNIHAPFIPVALKN